MNPQPNFNLIARPWRYLEYLTMGTALQQTRLHYLPTLTEHKRALILGDGDGRFLSALLTQNPTLQADTVDTSATMLHLLTQRCKAHATRLHTHHTDALTFTPSHANKYDLVVTHFFLDCFTQPDLEILITRITPHLAPKALWLISEFRIPPLSPMRHFARIYIRCLYLAQRILTGLRSTHLPNHAMPLTQAGLTRTACHQLLAGLLISELWQAR